MKIALNKPLAVVLMIVLLPFLLLSKVIGLLTGRPTRPGYENTINVDPLRYEGDKPVVVALWMSGASVWKAATESLIAELKGKYAGKCEFAYVEVTNREALEQFAADVIPVVIVRHHGKEVSRFVNMMSNDEITNTLNKLLTSDGSQ